MRLVRATPREIQAVVRGSGSYQVEIGIGNEGELTVYCTCPYAQEAGSCKHIWATLLEADARGSLSPALQAPLAAPDDSARSSRAARTAPWQQRLDRMRMALTDPRPKPEAQGWPADRRVVYIVDVPGTLAGNGLVLELGTQRRLKDGSWDRPRQFSFAAERWLQVPEEADRRVAQMLIGARSEASYHGAAPSRRFVIPETAFDTTLRAICETGRCHLRREAGEEHPESLAWDDGDPWRLELALGRPDDDDRRGGFRLTGQLRRGDEVRALADAALLLESGLAFLDGRVGRFEHGGAFALVSELRADGPLSVTARDVPRLLESLYALPRLPAVSLAPELEITELRPAPTPRLTVQAPVSRGGGAHMLPVALSFRYGDVEISAERPEGAVYDRSGRTVVTRDAVAEDAALERLRELGARTEYDYNARRPRLAVAPPRLDVIVRTLLADGWIVDAQGRVYRQAGLTHARLSSGVDWFELDAGVEFGDQRASLPQLLTALRRGERTVRLGDGSLGLLPDEWLRRYAPLAGAGTVEADGSLRFGKTQVALLDALLAEMPEIDADQRFEQAREELRAFERIEPADAPAGFHGELRPYQREGLGWLHFLRQFGFGGCLADDMGLGKTVMVLALLEARRAAKSGPSLVVVPKSLIFNWRQEAERFAPKLRVLEHTGPLRDVKALVKRHDYDLAITTYGTLRRDIADLRAVEFDYVVLDEAQAIKNADTAAAKAARLLRGEHRLALSGTPVENRLEELWSLFEFLNPGMLGASSLLAAAGAGTTVGDAEARSLLARGLRPFILRRTKDQVARELPEKQEQTLLVELPHRQRKLYDELRDHYRAALLGHIDRVGIKKSKIQILEALLRLRQAACHPALIDESHAGEHSGKLDALLPMLSEAAAEGHKVLVFSQFTSLLALVRPRLEAEGITYEYLDGKTRDRQERVERFQNDPACPVFLISLRAGGQGLNLTAADYVFLLDPWWNPAVEAQAVDRAHRIGQTRPVIATRLIARDTVEERVLELQASKRELADAVITADNSVIAGIEREELAALLG